MTVRRALARAVAAYRLLTLVYAAVLVAADHHEYQRPGLGWALLGVMAAWTIVATLGYTRPAKRVSVLLVSDVGVAVGMVLATLAVQTSSRIDAGAPTLPAAWAAASVMACAVFTGPWGGAIAGAAVSAADVAERGAITAPTFNGIVLLLLAGAVGGYLVRLAVAAEESVAEASKAIAAVGERERLAREIHDSTLQVLALIARRGREIGGETGHLAELAAAQEVSLRALVTSAAPRTGAATRDIRPTLSAMASARVTVGTPADPVELSDTVGDAVLGAVAEALANVERHAGKGARAWVLLEADGRGFTVSVRDDGAGIADGRLEAASLAGRLGVAQSIVGRIQAVGGTVSIESHQGEGTEVEIHVPR
ncbi:MAG: MacS family sensor histidine kinase [Mycobacteriales bacterium]